MSKTSKLSKAAFDFLHEHSPKSEWAAKTRYSTDGEQQSSAARYLRHVPSVFSATVPRSEMSEWPATQAQSQKVKGQITSPAADEPQPASYSTDKRGRTSEKRVKEERGPTA